jgi:hypothetical protein
VQRQYKTDGMIRSNPCFEAKANFCPCYVSIGYENKYGNAPADYTIPGEPAGLARIDSILGLNLYGASFGASPLVFGAFPSLHSGCATVQMLFLVYLRPRLWPLAFCYTLWLWWSTMYLTHHYMIDLVGGGIYAFLAFFAAYPFLPAVRPDARTRFDYLGITNVNLLKNEQNAKNKRGWIVWRTMRNICLVTWISKKISVTLTRMKTPTM